MSDRAPDPRLAVAAYLLERVGDLVEDRVFRPKLPQTQDKHMPRACIVVSGAGGASRYGDSYLPLGTPRLDVRCYGSSGLEADNIAQASLLALKRMRPCVSEGVRLYSASISAEPLPLIDPETNWPFTLVTSVVMCGEWVEG